MGLQPRGRLGVGRKSLRAPLETAKPIDELPRSEQKIIAARPRSVSHAVLAAPTIFQRRHLCGGDSGVHPHQVSRVTRLQRAVRRTAFEIVGAIAVSMTGKLAFLSSQCISALYEKGVQSKSPAVRAHTAEILGHGRQRMVHVGLRQRLCTVHRDFVGSGARRQEPLREGSGRPGLERVGRPRPRGGRLGRLEVSRGAEEEGSRCVFWGGSSGGCLELGSNRELV